MIKKEEILDLSRQLGLFPTTIEKDYVLGWILAGIVNHSAIAKDWVFKGGTCLKKCYFGNYRFSEDLDFTLLKSNQVNVDFLEAVFDQIGEWVYAESGIHLDAFRFEIYRNKSEGLSVQGRFKFQGPLRQKTNFPTIKLDLTSDEIVVLPPEIRPILHDYSDGPIDTSGILCYPKDEVFSEKLRALMQRSRPRDLYDVVHLFQKQKLDLATVKEVATQKFQFKKLPYPTFQEFQSHPYYPSLVSDWKRMIGHQVATLEPPDRYLDEISQVFKWLGSRIVEQDVAQSEITKAGS